MRSNSLPARIFCGGATVFCLMTLGVPNFAKPKLAEPLNAVAPAGSMPQACVGLAPLNGSGGPDRQTCPVNHAMYWVGGDAGKHKDGTTVNVTATCCPLPSNDILQEVHVFEPEQCPAETVATGAARQACGAASCPVMLRCTKINTARYQLGPELPAVYWGNGYAGWRNSERIDWEEIPAALRFAVGREKHAAHGVDGCVGYPWGSLFTKKTSKHCGGNYFKQLQFTGAPGDPARGIPVKMLADCDSIENADDPAQARCKHSDQQPIG